MKSLTYILFSAIFFPSIGQDLRKEAVKRYETGELAYHSGNYHEALKQFNECLTIDAGYYDAYTARAATKERLKDWSGAITDYSIYIERFPHHSETLFSRGLARYQAGQYATALEDFKEFDSMPKSGETQSIFYRQSAFGGGTDQIISVQGHIRDYVLNYIGLTEFKLEHYESAIAYFDSAIQINPREADYYVHRGLVKQEQGNLDGAEADYQQALNVNEDHSIARHNLSTLLNQKNDLAGAEEQLNQAIERNPDLSYPYLERGYHRMASGNLKGALQDYNKGISLNGGDPDSWVNRGLVKEKMNDLPGAARDYTEAISLKEDFEKAWFCRGNAFSKMNKLKEAVDDYSVAILYYPEYTQAYVNRAIIRHRLGQLKDACDDIQKAASLHAQGIDKIRVVVCKGN